MDARQLSNALGALGGDLGQVAGYEANKESQQAVMQQEDRRDAANKAFQAALENARMQQQQDQFNASKAQQQSQFNDTKAFQQQELASRTDYQNRSLAQQDELRKAQLAIENQRTALENRRIDAITNKDTTDRKSSIIGAQLTATGKLIQGYERQRDAEMAKLASDINLMGDPKSLAAAKQQVNAKYQPLIDKRQADYELLKNKFSQLNGIDMGDADTAAMMGTPAAAGAPGAPGSTGANPSAPAMPSSNGTETDDMPAGLPTAADGAGQTGMQPPVPGAKQAPDGNWYVPNPQKPGSYLRVDQ